jgi:glyoxylase-like metal-dependent hydrolase (beta-lactamase superfamily II)
MKIKKFTFNPFQENTYVLYIPEGPCIIIDPGCYFEEEEQELKSFIENNQLKPIKLINTHCHLDHICGNHFVAKTWNLKLEASPLDAYNLDLSIEAGKMYQFPIVPSPTIDVELKEGDVITFGDEEIQILLTPGHSLGSLSFYIPKLESVIAGDALFRLSVGRTDLPGGDMDTLLNSIRQKLFTLPENTMVYSGHGEETNIKFEKLNNPFLQDH